MAGKSTRRKIAIVGAEAKYWSQEKARSARLAIRRILEQWPQAIFISGDCPKGGVDIWVRKEASIQKRSFRAFPPKKHSWYWYKKRNIQIAEEADIVMDFEPVGHSSGGTWTAEYARKLGKITLRFEF